MAQSLWGAGQMMFNKYLVVADAATEIRRVEALAALVRRLDPARDLIAAEGVLDVLDHATATSGFGGKLALDLTRPPRARSRRCSCPNASSRAAGWRPRRPASRSGGARCALRRPEDGARRCGGVFGRNPVRGVKCAVLFDREAEGRRVPNLLWLARPTAIRGAT